MGTWSHFSWSEDAFALVAPPVRVTPRGYPAVVNNCAHRHEPLLNHPSCYNEQPDGRNEQQSSASS